MAIGDRLSNGTYHQEIKKNFHEFGNNLVRKAINVLFKNNLKDIMTGYRVFNKIGQQPIFSVLICGASGIGKTEVARLMADILYSNGLLRTNHYAEVKAGELIGKYWLY